ncbi:hypothetical protein JOF48_001164 [Arthrobacter stackebrandtii]|uniref:Glycoside hydrolase 35 catalytic domain-containing protein n=1 Tax=Arthrobacter stackebrandtii TaxID=272161 RepID=A0ABS4YUT6_9MICC|nr:beta-galactosidase [Arthrobacter stackebrandtii]MBP2412365.1 hypothetical protein [Arthrobacter stackebrandtii]PYH02139.1 hypothetical protein CVV67_01475 [Arthrobacter stackebrandtii]
MLHATLRLPEPPADTTHRPVAAEGGSTGAAGLPGTGTITANSRHLSRDGAPWFPVMGEYHFSRQDPGQWRTGLERMKQGGITVVSTYVFWNHHEEHQGTFRWTGSRNLRAFVELCAELGLDSVVRIGPWAHGEARNGGFPDWLQALPVNHRSDDPAYLAHVRPFFSQVADQLSGLFHGGGPIVAVQLENELYDQPGHILTLKHMAQELGMAPPLWTATAWGGAQLPAGEVLPLYGGYPEAFWEDAHPGWARGSRKHYFFSHIRDDHSIGADLRPTADSGTAAEMAAPYATCELGGGMPSAYHRRPIIPAADVSALALAKIGSGSVWQGYYMFHGASQGLGELSTLQESQSTGYPNDLPVMSYDFQAPLGEHGQVRESYHRLRAQHLFLAEAGPGLAGMPMTLPDTVPAGLDDAETLRWSVRSDGRAGFIFVNNHQPSTDALGAKEGVQFSVTLADGARLSIPRRPATIAAGAHFVWPFNLPLGHGATLVHTTAQLLTSLPVGPRTCFVFSRTEGVDTEFEVALPADDGGTRQTIQLAVPPGPGPVELPVTDRVSILLIDGDDALRAWKADFAGAPRIILADSLLASAGTLRLDITAPRQEVGIYPPVDNVAAVPGDVEAAVSRLGGGGPLDRFTVEVPAGSLATAGSAELLQEAAGPAPLRTGGVHGRAAAPLDSDYETAALFQLDFTAEQLPETGQNLLRISWTGDAARAFIAGALVSDNYWNGLAWAIDLAPHRDALLRHGLQIRAFPLNPDAPIYVDESIRPGRTTLDIPDVRILHRRHMVLTGR